MKTVFPVPRGLEARRRRVARVARRRNHWLRWSLHQNGYKTIWVGKCVHCDAWAQAKSRVEPNDCGEGGPAVAVNCPWKEESRG